MGTTQECYQLFLTNPGSIIPQNSSCTATSHLKKTKHPSKMNKTCRILLKKQGQTHK